MITLDIKYLLTLLLCFFALSISKAEVIYTMELKNGIFIDQRTYEFEIYIMADQGDFTLNAYQCSFLFNKAIINYGILSFEYIQGTCELNNKPAYGIGVSGSFWMPVLTFASYVGQDLIQNTIKRLGKFRIRNSVTFGGNLPAIKWQFGNLYPTIICGNGYKNITNPAFHTYNNFGFPLHISKGWNFISIPMKLKNMSFKSIFPSAISNAFLNTNLGYKSMDSAEVGKAYWIEFSQESITEIKGEVIEFPISLNKGWNTIGLFHYNLSVAEIKTNPEFIITGIFGINNSQYYSTNVFEPGKGYQVYSEEDGFLVLNNNSHN